MDDDGEITNSAAHQNRIHDEYTLNQLKTNDVHTGEEGAEPQASQHGSVSKAPAEGKFSFYNREEKPSLPNAAQFEIRKQTVIGEEEELGTGEGLNRERGFTKVRDILEQFEAMSHAEPPMDLSQSQIEESRIEGAASPDHEGYKSALTMKKNEFNDIIHESKRLLQELKDMEDNNVELAQPDLNYKS